MDKGGDGISVTALFDSYTRSDYGLSPVFSYGRKR